MQLYLATHGSRRQVGTTGSCEQPGMHRETERFLPTTYSRAHKKFNRIRRYTVRDSWRAIRTPRRSFRIRTMSAAAIEMSDPAPMATPTSAFAAQQTQHAKSISDNNTPSQVAAAAATTTVASGKRKAASNSARWTSRSFLPGQVLVNR